MDKANHSQRHRVRLARRTLLALILGAGLIQSAVVQAAWSDDHDVHVKVSIGPWSGQTEPTGPKQTEDDQTDRPLPPTPSQPTLADGSEANTSGSRLVFTGTAAGTLAIAALALTGLGLAARLTRRRLTQTNPRNSG